jgi:DNA-binding CsgD family transcriptional regulator
MLVGRAEERGRIDALVRSVRAGEGALLALTGPPGIGKTALLDYAAAQAAGLTVLRATGSAFESTLAWGGLHQLLGSGGADIDRLPAEQAAALRGALRLGPATGDDAFLVFLAVLTLWSQIATGSGLLCLVDDGQWLDDPTGDALRFVGRRLGHDPIGLVVAERDQPPSRFTADRWPGLEVPGLPVPEMRELLGAYSPPGGSAAVRDRMVEYAYGNPLAAIETARTLSGDQWAGRRPLADPLPLTAGIEAAFLDQVRRLSGDAQSMLLVAACADGTATPAQIFAAGESLGLSAGSVAVAEQAGLLTVTANAVRFRHPVVGSAVLGAATFLQRQAAHRALAGAMTAASGDDADTDRRVWHLAAACLGPHRTVADDLEAAADRDRRRSAFAAAAAALERSAELSPDRPDRARRRLAAGEAAFAAGQPERALAAATAAERDADGEPVLRAGVAALRGQVHLRGGLLGEAAGTLADGALLIADTVPELAAEMLFRAAEAAGFAGAPATVFALAAQARALPVSTPRGRVLQRWLTATADLLSGELERGTGVLGAASRDLVELFGPQWTVVAPPGWLMWAGYGAVYLGDVRQMIVLFEAAARRARAAGDLADLPLALHGLSVTHSARGRFAEAEAAAAEGLRLADETGQEAAACLNLAALVAVAGLRGDDDRCRTLGAQALARSVPRQVGLAVARTNWAIAVLDLGAGQFDTALTRLAALTSAGPGSGHFLITLYAIPDLVEAAVQCGDLETAHRATADLAGLIANSPAPSSRAWLARCHALIAEPTAAVKHLQNAVALYDLGEERFEQARAQLLLGEALRRQRRRNDARDVLRTALPTFEAMAAQAWAERARRELRALGDLPPTAPVAGAAQLTPQELQIATLVSGGASNRDIAAQLFLSVRTVEYHLYKVFPKLGVTSRAELARRILTGSAGPLTDGRS